MPHEHHFTAQVRWSGSTAAGYRGYTREHEVTVPPVSAAMTVTAAPEFLGAAEHRNPEQLLLAAASSCQLLAFLAVAARAGLDVLAYADDSEAVMPVTREPMRITRIVLRPRIVVAAGTDHDVVERAVHQGHDECFIANTLNCEMRIEPDIVDAQ